MLFVIGYAIVSLSLFWPIFKISYKSNREQAPHLWETKQWIAFCSFFLTVAWIITVPFYIFSLLVDRWEDGLDKEIREYRNVKKFEARDKISHDLKKIEFESAMLEATGWNVFKVHKIHKLCSEAYKNHFSNLKRVGWTEDEIYDMFFEFVPRASKIRELGRK